MSQSIQESSSGMIGIAGGTGSGVPIKNVPAGINIKSIVTGWPWAFVPSVMVFLTGTPSTS